MCFFFNDTATTEIYTLSLHDALPISTARGPMMCPRQLVFTPRASSMPCRAMFNSNGLIHPPGVFLGGCAEDRKSTRLNSSHANISYAVFCLKKKKHVLHHLLSR